MTQKTLRLNHSEIKPIIYRWWQSMMLSDAALKAGNIPKAPSGTRARLQRCQTINDILINPDFYSLWQKLPDDFRETATPRDVECCALIAGMVVFVRSEPQIARSVARLAGTPASKGSPAPVSEMRFARLQASQTPDVLLRTMRRVMKQLNCQASISQLVDDLYQWTLEYHNPYPRKADERIRIRWSMDYFSAASSSQ